MKIAILQRFLPGSSRGGVGHFTHGLANALVKRGHQVTVFSRDPAPSDADYSVFKVSPDRKKSRWDFLWFPFEAALCDFSSFDILHAQGDEQWVRHTLPVVRTMHGSALVEAYYNGIAGLSLKHLLMHLYFYFWEIIASFRADFIAAVSKDTTRYYFRHHAVIGNGIDLQRFTAAKAEKAKHPAVLFVGELSSRKRGDLLVRIFREEIKPKIPACELWLVSPEKAEGEGIRCFGAVSAEELAALYQKAWVFCLPSSYEGFGRPYAEAMAAGTTVLSTPNPGAREVLNDGDYGCLAPAAKIGETLARLLNDPAQRKKYEEEGLKRAQIYGWETIAGEYEAVYKKLIHAR